MSKVLTADEAAGMTRAQALRALATGEGVPEKDRRIAELMLAGPEIDGLPKRTFVKPLVAAVNVALWQIGAECREQRLAAEADLRELSGGLA